MDRKIARQGSELIKELCASHEAVALCEGEPGGAGAPEIAITPQMLRAGVEVLMDFDPCTSITEDAARASFLAMLRAAPKLQPEHVLGEKKDARKKPRSD